MRGTRRFCLVFFLLCAALAQGRAVGGEPGRRQRHDPLPSRFAALNKYDKIALEPYRDKYDDMPLHEKARVYSQAFESMNNRKPNFAPDVLARIDQSEKGAEARSAYEMKKDMYKPAPEPRERRSSSADPNARMLSAIPVPWAEPATPEPQAEAEPPPEDDHRFESLRNRALPRSSRQR